MEGSFLHILNILRPPQALALAFLFLLGGATEAHAYVDPGSGAMLWQAMAASAVGALFYLRKLSPVQWLRSLLHRDRPQPR